VKKSSRGQLTNKDGSGCAQEGAAKKAKRALASSLRRPIHPRVRFVVLLRDDFTCRYCGASRENGAVLELDHVVPVAAGGGNEASNLVTACTECNAGKGDLRLGVDVGHSANTQIPDPACGVGQCKPF
jgi:5-methylcytosine-specific restriction endonuclease McrA